MRGSDSARLELDPLGRLAVRLGEALARLVRLRERERRAARAENEMRRVGAVFRHRASIRAIRGAVKLNVPLPGALASTGRPSTGRASTGRVDPEAH